MTSQARTTTTSTEKPDLTSGRNLLFVLLVSRVCLMMIFMPAITQGTAGEDSWAAALLSLAWSIPLSLLAVWAATAVPGGLLVDANRKWGKLSLLIFAPYILVLALVPGFYSAQLGTLFATVTLTETPVGALVAVALVVGTYAAYQGIDTIGRVGQVIITVLAVFLAVGFLGVAYEADSARLQPMFSRGLLPVLSSSVNPAAWTVIALSVLPVLGRHVAPNTRGLQGVAIWANAASMGLLTVTVMVTTMVFTAQEAQTMHSPAYVLAKMIRIPLTFERLEVIILTAWIGAITLTVGTYLYTAAQAISDALSLKTHRTCLLPLALFVAASAVTLFASTSVVKHYVASVAPPVAALAVGLPAAAALALRRRTAGEQDG
ncbi:MAG: GerAB/ArcD/ProY family transporter [Bacillota bacterium]|nr:GerAB/ArcD/ProY family transporter [Bacillota bacterium]